MYQPGRKMVISDALSHLSIHQIPDTKETVPGLNVTKHEVGVFSNTDNTSMQNIQKERKLRQSCLARLHIVHMIVNKTLYQARQSVLSPSLNKDINEIISACPACMKYIAKNCAKPLINNLATSKP